MANSLHIEMSGVPKVLTVDSISRTSNDIQFSIQWFWDIHKATSKAGSWAK
jgi:hypothetical protein